MSDPVWPPEKAAQLLAEVYAGSLGEGSDIDPATQAELARDLDADPAYLEATWEAWLDPMYLYGWREERIDAARYWLDAEFLGGLASP
jgi:hypothetical protein